MSIQKLFIKGWQQRDLNGEPDYIAVDAVLQIEKDTARDRDTRQEVDGFKITREGRGGTTRFARRLQTYTLSEIQEEFEDALRAEEHVSEYPML